MHHRIMVHRERESKNEIARFGLLKPPIPAISNASVSEKQTPTQSLRTLFTDDYLISSNSGDLRPIFMVTSRKRRTTNPAAVLIRITAFSGKRRSGYFEKEFLLG